MSLQGKNQALLVKTISSNTLAVSKLLTPVSTLCYHAILHK